MKITENYASIVNEACKIAKATFNNHDSIQRVEKSEKNLQVELKGNAYIKIPFVGDFNAGKSSLLNSLMGINLLPTDVVPTTAVSYELYYSETEKLTIFHNGELKQTTPLSKISALDVVPGDVVAVYVNNDFIKGMNDKGIVLVDMPGIDSGIEAHNNAILNYIQEGTFFFLVSPAPQGTLRSSTLQFADELKKYKLQMAVIISKTDQTAEKILPSVIAQITDQAKRLIGEDVQVGTTSSAEGKNQDVIKIISGLDTEKLIVERISPAVTNFINDIISELRLQAQLLISNKEDYTAKIEQLKIERDKALDALRAKDKSAQPLSNSADDILDDIKTAIIGKSSYLANIIVQSNNDSNTFKAELLNIIRPILVNSFKREITEYQDQIGSSVMDFSQTVDSILRDEDNKVLDGLNDVIKNMMGKDVLDAVLKKGLDKLMAKLVNYKGLSTLLKTLSKIIGPITTILINILPDILRLIFGKSKSQKAAAIQEKIANEMVSKLVEGLRAPIENMLEEQRRSAYNEMENIIESEAQKYDDNIKKMQEAGKADEATVTAKVQALQVNIGELENLLKNVI